MNAAQKQIIHTAAWALVNDIYLTSTDLMRLGHQLSDALVLEAQRVLDSFQPLYPVQAWQDPLINQEGQDHF